VTTELGTQAKRFPPPRYPWADPEYLPFHASIVPCNRNLLEALRGERLAETAGEDNLKTVRLVFAAYDSAQSGEAIRIGELQEKPVSARESLSSLLKNEQVLKG